MRIRYKNTLRQLNRLRHGKNRRIEVLSARLRRRDEKIAGLEEQLQQLRLRYEPRPLAGHTYPLQLIALAIFMRVHANSSLRCAAKTVGFVAQLLGWPYSAPVHATVDNWVRRLGLFALRSGAAKQGEYVTIIDESIQIGCEKALLMLGVKLHADQCHAAPLQFDDVEVLGLQVAESWTAEGVQHFIAEQLDHHDQIELAYAVCDGGTNLNKALSATGLTLVADCSHKLMNGLKKLLADCAALGRLTRFMGQYRRKYILSQSSHLCPPTLRDKDRFLRLFTVVDWVDRLERYWSTLEARQRQQLQYLRTPNVQHLVRQLRQLRSLVATVSKIIKSMGISPHSHRRWLQALAEYEQRMALTPKSRRLVDLIAQYFDEHLPLLGERDYLLACSDIIESTFGHYKNKGGMKVISSDVLYLPLLAKQITLDYVAEGLSQTSQKAVDDWHRRNTCPTRYSRLHKVVAKVNILSVDHFAHQLEEGREFTFSEGLEPIGTGTILAIVNKQLDKQSGE